MTALQITISVLIGLSLLITTVWKFAKALENGLKGLGTILAAPIEKAVASSAENEKRFNSIENAMKEQQREHHAELTRMQENHNSLKTDTKETLTTLLQRVDAIYLKVAGE